MNASPKTNATPATRTETDSMGPMEVPVDALYGASTQRAVLNFPISGEPIGRELIRALGLVKWAAAEANLELGLLSEERASLIARAAEEVVNGELDAHFPIDIFQTGSGTSSNMNANEVIANRCARFAGQSIGSHDPVHPNDHVNLCQSSNDVFPTAIHLATGEALQQTLIPALDALHDALDRKALRFWEIIKIGRTHLMDATPIRLGQEFSGFARQVEQARHRAEAAVRAVEEVPLGGTAVGTGINCHPNFAFRALRHLQQQTGIAFREARNHFEAQGARDGLVEASGQLKTIAVALFKIANDLRWLGSGPHCGIGELALPATQPGSSIMPGKVNPVMSEMLMQVCAQVIGNDTAITWGGANGSLQLNTMMPLMARNLLSSIRLLANACDTFRQRCVEGLEANAERCTSLVEHSLSMVTSLAPIIGYDRAAQIAKESAASGKTIRELCTEQEILPAEELERVLNPVSMTEPHPPGK